MTHKYDLCKHPKDLAFNKHSYNAELPDFSILNTDVVAGASVCLETGLIAPLGTKAKCSPPPHENRRAIRRDRYDLSKVSRSIFAAEGAKAGLKYVLNYHRAAKCSYIELGDVAVHKSKKFNSAFFSGLTTCGSVWACPNCAAKVQERRRIEIAKAMDYFYNERNMKAVMVTLTFPHGLGDNLEELLFKQKEALKRLRKGGAWDRLKDSSGYEGLIRSLEVTYGQNGWHPHTHELWFVDKDADAEDMKRKIISKWLLACDQAGLIDYSKRDAEKNFKEYSVDVKNNASTSDYLAKQDDSRHWGADREIAKASTKQGRSKGIHPFMFLTNFKETHEAKWARRWVEYNKEFKGKAQLFWSRKLKSKCGVLDVSDEELAVIQEDDAIKIYDMTREEWRKVRNRPAKILDLCEQTSKEVVIRAVIEHLIPVEPDVEVRAKVENEMKIEEPVVLSEQQISEVVEPFLAQSHYIKNISVHHVGSKVVRDRRGNVRVGL